MDAHKAAFEYDWRNRLHTPLTAVGTSEMTWGEALRQTKLLRVDPSSQVAAAVEGWDHPISREALAILDLFDWTRLVDLGGKKVDPHPMRPWKQKPTPKRMGDTGGRTPDNVRAILAAARTGSRVSADAGGRSAASPR